MLQGFRGANNKEQVSQGNSIPSSRSLDKEVQPWHFFSHKIGTGMYSTNILNAKFRRYFCYINHTIMAKLISTKFGSKFTT